MTVHWINQKSLKRQKAAVACFRVIRHHTYDVLTAKIEEVLRNFGLQGKISATVTDNGSNFVKLFKSFSVQETGVEINKERSITDESDDADMALDDNSRKSFCMSCVLALVSIVSRRRSYNFLKEYCAVLEPLSRGLDILQGEDHCY